jgi:NAD(P)-dependent dehydrogenase (short-subunit alcohol dehydrogenase family)
MKHEGKIALVTGAVRGIGKAVAYRFASEGADIIIADKELGEEADATAEEFRALGRQVWLYQVDMKDPKEIRAFTKAVKKDIGKLDILIHNAAFGTMANVLRIGLFSWKAALDINVTALLLLSQQLAPLLAKSKGHIVAMSSIGAGMAFSEYACVGVTKAAVESLIRYLAFELGPLGIHCNAVSAGPIQTRALDWFKYPHGVHKYSETKTTWHRMGQPGDVVGVMSFLCTPDAHWIVGQVLRADGGITMGEDFLDWVGPEEREEALAKRAKDTNVT